MHEHVRNDEETPIIAAPSSPALNDTLPESTPPAVLPEQAATDAAPALWRRARQWVADNTFRSLWLPEPIQPPSVGYLMAVALEIVAALLTLVIILIIPTFSFVSILTMFVVVVVALTWGAAPGLLAAWVGIALLTLVALPIAEHTTGLTNSDAFELFVGLLIGSLISIFASGTEQARRRAVSAQALAQANETALRETNARADEFLSIASHELRSPLTSLKAALQLAQRRLRRMDGQELDAADLAAHLEALRGLLVTAENQVDRQDRLVGDLLDVSRIRAGRLEFRTASCDLVDIVTGAVDEQRMSWPDREISLDASATLLPIEADAQRIGQVVTNFLTNALKYSPPSTPAAVIVRQEAGAARVEVRDHGPGLTAAQQTRIWERFHRVPDIRQLSGSGTGLGLGLHISRTIIEQHHGRVGIESTPGQGCAFWFTLPLVQHD